jgi:tyrosinase
MRAAVFLAAVAPVVSSVIPGIDEHSSAHSFDRRDDFTSGVLGGKILSSDLYAGVAALNQQIYQATQQPGQWKKCNPLNIVVRREWASFTAPQKENYIAAVKCLTKLPPKTPKSSCPGCKNRFDDFVATHIQQTFSIHNTGYEFLSKFWLQLL